MSAYHRHCYLFVDHLYRYSYIRIYIRIAVVKCCSSITYDLNGLHTQTRMQSYASIILAEHRGGKRTEQMWRI